MQPSSSSFLRLRCRPSPPPPPPPPRRLLEAASAAAARPARGICTCACIELGIDTPKSTTIHLINTTRTRDFYADLPNSSRSSRLSKMLCDPLAARTSGSRCASRAYKFCKACTRNVVRQLGEDSTHETASPSEAESARKSHAVLYAVPFALQPPLLTVPIISADGQNHCRTHQPH